MNNHFHLVMETPRPNLADGMRWLLGVYTSRFNRRHKLCGHLFSGRYKSLLVEGSGNGYLKTVCDYVHLNPVRAKLLKSGQALDKFRWSSYGYYLQARKKRPPWLRVDRVLGEMALPSDQPVCRREFARRMEKRRREEEMDHAAYRKIRRGWYFGQDEFRRELLQQIYEQRKVHHHGEELRESEEEKGERLVRMELKKAGIKESELILRRKADPVKIDLLRQIRQETTLSLRWVCQRLEMGSWRSINGRLH